MPPAENDVAYYFIEVGNKDHRHVFQRMDAIYGNDFFILEINRKLTKKIQDESMTNTGYMALELRQTQVKALNTDEKRCDESMTNPNIGRCVIKYVEDTIGCSMAMGLSGSNPNIQR